MVVTSFAAAVFRLVEASRVGGGVCIICLCSNLSSSRVGRVATLVTNPVTEFFALSGLEVSSFVWVWKREKHVRV